MDKTTVGNLCKPYIGQLKLDDNTLIDYFDIASVDNIEKQITGYTTYKFAEAPSRARKKVEKGNILVSTVRPNLNAVALFDEETENMPVASTGFCVLECKANTSPRFLFRYLQSQSFVRAMVSQATGASYPAVSDKIVRDTKLPAYSYEEQIQIANVLDATANIISKRKHQLKKLDELVKARFVEMFGGIHNISKYPYKSIKELTDVISGGTPSRDISEYWDSGTIPWVKTTELQNNMIVETEEYITEMGLNNSSAKIVPPGTVLIAMYGQGKTRGMTAYLGIEACTNQACACILPSDKINQTFLWQFLILSYDNLRDKAKGGNQPNLNGNIIKNYPVLCPPKELQQRFAAFVEQVNKSKAAVQKALDEAQLLFDSLMQKYFE